MKELIYEGRELKDAFRIIANDLLAMGVMVRLVTIGESRAISETCARQLRYRAKDFINLVSYHTPPTWQQTVISRANMLLHEIHHLLRLPRWRYTLVNTLTECNQVELWKEITLCT